MQEPMKRYNVQLTIGGDILATNASDLEENIASAFAHGVPHISNIEVVEVETLEVTTLE